MAGLEGIDATSMELVDALQARFVYDEETRIAKPLVRHADFVPVAVHGAAVAAAKAKGGEMAATFEDAADDERVIARVRFGMPGFQGRLITNARNDSLQTARSWKALLGKPRYHCLTAVSYVVERAAPSGASKPPPPLQGGATYRIQRRDGKPMVVPGLCAVRHLSFASTGNEYDDLCHVQVTADADRFVGKVHDRFVVDLDAAAREAWMAADGDCIDLLVPADDDTYEMVPISAEVWTRRKDPDGVAPVGKPIVWGDVEGKGQQTL